MKIEESRGQNREFIIYGIFLLTFETNVDTDTVTPENHLNYIIRTRLHPVFHTLLFKCLRKDENTD